MFKGGIFLPMEEHVSRYCRSSHYRYCKQYIRGCTGIEDTVRKFGLQMGSSDSRRSHERLLKKFPLRIYACDEQGKSVRLLSDNAETVDLSQGGIGMRLPSQLEAGQQIALHFGAGFAIPGLSSKGTICWCHAAGDDYYQAGVAFAGNQVGQVVAGLVAAES